MTKLAEALALGLEQAAEMEEGRKAEGQGSWLSAHRRGRQEGQGSEEEQGW